MTEVILVLIILAIGFGFSILYTQNIQISSDINTISSNFVEFTRNVQSNSKSGNQNLATGIHLEATKYVLFEGGVYDPNSQTNYTVQLPSTVVIQNINLNGGGSDVIFSSPKGATNNYGTFSFFSSQTNKLVLITITKIGTVEY